MLCAFDQITLRERRTDLAEPWIDTRSELGEIFAALVGWVARKTRNDILQRTSAGRERARLKGVRFERRPKLSSAERQEALSRRDAGEPFNDIAAGYCVSRSTITRLKSSTEQATDGDLII